MNEQATTPVAEGPEAVSEFHIAGTSSTQQRRTRTLKNGDSFALFDQFGDIGTKDGSPEGLYHEDTRHLSHLELRFEGRPLMLLSSTLQDDNSILTIDLANPDMYRESSIALARETIHVRRSKFLWRSGCHERIAIRNYDRSSHSLRLTLRFDADFADLFEVRGARRKRRGVSRIERVGLDAVVMRYLGLDRVERTTRIDFTPAPTALGDREAIFDLELAPEARTSLFVAIRCDSEGPVARGDFFSAMRQARRDLRISSSRAASIDSSNMMLNRALSRSVADLYMLMTETPQGPYPYAGIPWFSTAFGRDGVITALEMLWLDANVAKGVLNFLAAKQARAVDPEADAEPGKILHETRHGEMARLKEIPFGLYYGSVDATPLFVMLAGRYFERTGDHATMQALWPHLEAALRWIDSYGDPDGDGFVEYHAREGKALTNQGWKDSEDSISHADGRLAAGPIALCEVQGYVYAAKRLAIGICRALGHDVVATRLQDQAESLRERFEAAFWCEEIGSYALALDGAKQQCRVRASNAGHVLYSGIASDAHAARVAATLMSRDSYSGWGVRTLATSECRFNPMSYHNGSIWPHDNAIIALGLARYGFKRDAMRVFEGMFDAMQYMDLVRPPELFCGFSRRRGRAPTKYPIACSPQAWASAAPLAFLEACLGLQCDHAKGEIRFERPMLPSFVDEVRLRDLRLGEASVDVLLRRHGSDVAVIMLERRGSVRVVVVN